MNAEKFRLNLNALLVLLSGIFTLNSILFSLVHLHKFRVVLADAHFTVLAGISLIYLATLLKRGKYNAWRVSLVVYAILIIRNLEHLIARIRDKERITPSLIALVLPVFILFSLIVYRRYYTVRSELLSFRLAAKRSVLMLIIAFFYGLVGFQIMDVSDFNQEISLKSAAHYSVDQFGLTTNKAIEAYTTKGRIFVDSLAAISLAAIFYSALAFFAPIKFKYTSHEEDIVAAVEVCKKHSRTSEDFFKFWPNDKDYFLNSSRTAFVAYRVVRSVALVVGDPAGPEAEVPKLLEEFLAHCRLNDWQVAFVHADPHYEAIYDRLGFAKQKIGEEAMLDIDTFTSTTIRNKYFRHIVNKFTKLEYSYELLSPPFSADVLSQVNQISVDWLDSPGREERGFMLGYFSLAYINQCKLLVAKDDQGKIVGFINQVPSFVPGEANYDFLRHLKGSQGNINDFIMIGFINELSKLGYKKLNMGLCPLSGIKISSDSDSKMIDSLLSFVYTNAGRIYSFQGLKRFKSKYEPNWESRYLVYKGSIPGLTRSGNALLKAMTHYKVENKTEVFKLFSDAK